MTGYQSKKAAAQGKLTVDRTQVEQWLEALKDIDSLHHSQEPESVDAQKAIADMGQALAQPEQERTWVDLTKEEKDACVLSSIYHTAWSSDIDIETLVEVVSAMLKEKNF